jgi:hypothetical protein
MVGRNSSRRSPIVGKASGASSGTETWSNNDALRATFDQVAAKALSRVWCGSASPGIVSCLGPDAFPQEARAQSLPALSQSQRLSMFSDRCEGRGEAGEPFDGPSS